MTSIKEIQPMANIPSMPMDQPDKINVFLLMAQVQGSLAEESMKKQDEARIKAKAARLIEGIMKELAKHNPLDVEKMKAQFEELKENLRGGFLSIPLEKAILKVDSMLTGAIELKAKVDQATKELKDINNESDKEIKEYKRLQAKLAAKEKELSKWSWVPGYGAALAIEVLILKGRVSSAAERVKGVQERIGGKQIELNALVSQMNNKKEILVDEMGVTAQKLSSEAESEMAALQMIMDSALNSINIITGGK